MSKGAEAEISVVVPSVNGWPDLQRCLTALERARALCAMDVIVPERVGSDVQERVRRQFSWVRVLPVAVQTTIPEMRALGFDAATSPVIAVIEDHVIVPPSWGRQMVDALSEDVQVVAGTLVNTATHTTVDWAAFFCEYSHVLVPPVARAVSSLMGNNTAYDASVIKRFSEVVHSNRWENALHDAMHASGVKLNSRPDIVAAHEKHYTVWEYTSQRYWYSRAYAGDRVRGWTVPKRALYGVAAIALPAILAKRVVGRAWSSGVHRGALIRSLPLFPIFFVAWALGETVGAWFGSGDALAKVK